MDVQLYVYDLSRGMARSMSMAFLGTQIDAVYHTSVVLNGIEYFFGQGIQRCRAGTTHHGSPMEVVNMGRTSLPQEVIMEYLDSLRQVYSPASYDLFAHNCNNFSHDFCLFLTGKPIPGHITSLPATVLNTPFGQMLRPQIESAMRPVTQAPLPQYQPPAAVQNGNHPVGGSSGIVQNVVGLQKLNNLLDEARSKCAVIFFTSATCPPCKLVYPVYDQMAAEAGDKAILIKVDTSSAYDIASKYSISATPTFITFLKGKEEERWSGADTARISGTVRLLIQAAFPQHPHRLLNLPNFRRHGLSPVLYTKIPPLEKLVAKIGSHADPSVSQMVSFIKARDQKGSQEAPLPDLPVFGVFLQHALTQVPVDCLFAAYDLFRLALVDARVSGFYLEEPATSNTLSILLRHTSQLGASCPYNLRLVTIQLACNAFTTPLLERALHDSGLASLLVSLVTESLLDEAHTHTRVAAASLAYNLATIGAKSRQGEQKSAQETLPEHLVVELAASLVEAISSTQSQGNAEALKAMVLALARLVYCAPEQHEVIDVCRALEAGQAVRSQAAHVDKADRTLVINEIGGVLLDKGLRQR